MRGWIGPAVAFSAALAALLPSHVAFAWGPQGHRAVALIADRVLRQSDAATHGKLLAILATDKDDRLTKTDIASEATWADVLREKSPEARTATTGWHYTRLKADNPDFSSACFGHKPLPVGYPASRGPQDNCSVDKILQFETELKNAATSEHEKLAAVKFLLNLVADVNDPLHAIDHGDSGGECVAVQIGGKPPVRLATYWQETLVREVTGSDAASGAARIAAAIPAGAAAKWAAGDPASWARESYEIAKSVVYSFAAGQPAGQYSFPAKKGESTACASVPLYKVGPEYETKALAALKERLAVAGIRLAQVLRDSLK